MSDRTERRKREHLALFKEGGVGPRRGSTWLQYVRLVHQALTEVDAERLDLSTELAGRTLQVPLMITGMTGGTAEARQINRGLAAVAQEMGVGFGLGSQRAMLERPQLAGTYAVRDVAPDIFVAGNLGMVQVARTPTDAIAEMLARVGADALCVHLNPGQELVQREGDRAFAGAAEALARLVQELPLPVIVKETGCGISREVAEQLVRLGVRTCDVAGAGGTSWIGAELMRSGDDDDPERAAFWDWGIPTAAALLELEATPLAVVASGGIRTGVDAARALALGATACGMAAPVIQAWFEGGREDVRALLEDIVAGVRMAMALTGSQTVAELRRAPRVLLGPLREWALQRT